MDRKHLLAGLVIAAASFTAAPAFADDGVRYATGATTKLGRGVVNTATGWVEVPKQAAIGARQAGLPGLIGGTVKGVGMGVARTVVGGFEIVTFWAPVPDRFAPVMNPPTVFDRR